MGERGKKWPKNWPKNGSRMAIFPFFGHFSPFFSVGPKSIFRPFCFPFAGPRPDLGCVLGNRDCNLRVLVFPVGALFEINPPGSGIDNSWPWIAMNSASKQLIAVTFATRAAIYRSLRALRARNRKKSLKRVFLGVWRKFDPFWDFFAISGPEGPETPVNGGSGRKVTSG